MVDTQAALALVNDHLGASPRARHSIFVGEIMAALAEFLNQDSGLWRITGYCHDLDYFEIDRDWQRHGMVTRGWLANQLPEQALDAIAAHDHRSPVTSDSLMADGLKLADALAILDEMVGRQPLSGMPPIGARRFAEIHVPDKLFLGDMIARYSDRCGISIDVLTGIVTALPVQEQPGASP